MSEAIKRRVAEKRLARDKVVAKLASIRNLMASYRVAESKHEEDLSAKNEVLGMLEELDRNVEALNVRAVELRPKMQALMDAHREAGTPYRTDPEYKVLAEEHDGIAGKIREMESDANKIYYGKMKH